MNTSLSNALLTGLVIVTITFLAVSPAIAHHSFAEFNMNEEKTVTGIVKTVEWTNPHIWIWIDVPNDKGSTDTYGFEGMSPNFLERRNWRRTTLKPGDTITVSYRPLRSGKNGGMWVTGKMTNGKILTGGGGRE